MVLNRRSDDEVMEPIMCPFCGGDELMDEELSEIETDTEYWVIYHWRCQDCGERFEKIVSSPLSEAFEDVEDEGPLWS